VSYGHCVFHLNSCDSKKSLEEYWIIFHTITVRYQLPNVFCGVLKIGEAVFAYLPGGDYTILHTCGRMFEDEINFHTCDHRWNASVFAFPESR